MTDALTSGQDRRNRNELETPVPGERALYPSTTEDIQHRQGRYCQRFQEIMEPPEACRAAADNTGASYRNG
jgi:hypothetical protein